MSDKVLIYLGPTLDLETAKSILPEAIYLPPIRHADLVSHIPVYRPDHIIIVDGVFGDNLPVWHKEILFALLNNIRVYGCSSMGALRASELADFGMIGIGKIFEWYYEGVIDADDEVACLYHQTPKGEYIYDTWPLVNVRAGCFEDRNGDSAFVEKMAAIHWTKRTPECFGKKNFDGFHDQKALDAMEALMNFRNYSPVEGASRPDLSFITPLFTAVLEREKRVEIDGVVIPLQHIDSFISLHSPEHHQIRFDAQNRALVMVLADVLGVRVSEQEVKEEAGRFCARNGLETADAFLEWCAKNGISASDFDVLCIQNARIRKLQKALVTSMMFRRQTRIILDYMRTHNQLRLWLSDCADTERLILEDGEEQVVLDPGKTIMDMLYEHLNEAAISIDGDIRSFVRDTGIGTVEELGVCLSRYALSREKRANLSRG